MVRNTHPIAHRSAAKMLTSCNTRRVVNSRISAKSSLCYEKLGFNNKDISNRLLCLSFLKDKSINKMGFEYLFINHNRTFGLSEELLKYVKIQLGYAS